MFSGKFEPTNERTPLTGRSFPYIADNFPKQKKEAPRGELLSLVDAKGVN